MKKLCSILLIVLLSTTIIVGNAHNTCTSCTQTPSSHCNKAISKTIQKTACHDTAAAETKPCCSSENQSGTNCELCSSHTQPIANEKILDSHIKSHFQLEIVAPYTRPFPKIYPNHSKKNSLKMRQEPFVTHSLTSLKTIRLLC